MKCRFPILLAIEKRQIYVPCGKCAWCLDSLRNEWFFRLKQESMHHQFTSFVTLTYRDQDLPFHVDDNGVIHYDVSKEHIRSFHEDLWRKYEFRYMVCSEYGSKSGRPHYHGVYFHDEPIRFIDFWPFGDNNSQFPARDGSFKYVLKYTLKGSNVPEGSEKNFRLMSRRPGLGSNFKYDGQKFLLSENGKAFKVPRYYKKGYIKSLPETMAKYLKESTLDYLHTVGLHEKLKQRYDELLSSGSIDSSYGFEQYVWDLYRKDYLKQVKINNKNE